MCELSVLGDGGGCLVEHCSKYVLAEESLVDELDPVELGLCLVLIVLVMVGCPAMVVVESAGMQ